MASVHLEHQDRRVRLIVQVRKDPPELSAHEYRQLLAVYRHGVFRGLYGQVSDFGPDDVVHTIESVLAGTAKFATGQAFANVIGSSGDPKIDGQTWVGLWAAEFGVYPGICTSYDFNGFDCSNYIVGGHIIPGKQAERMPPGSTVYIMPICQKHNRNDSVYMAALQFQNAVWLEYYLGP
jgi:hypothetical protein